MVLALSPSTDRTPHPDWGNPQGEFLDLEADTIGLKSLKLKLLPDQTVAPPSGQRSPFSEYITDGYPEWERCGRKMGESDAVLLKTSAI